MARRPGHMRLGAFLHPSGHHVAAWRHPDASEMTRLSDFVNLARMAEDAKFDCIFLADHSAVRLGNPQAASRRSHSGVVPFEPVTLLSALAGVTSHVGLIATSSTSFNEPYNLARQFQSLDLLSGGRAGWNLVTSSDPDSSLNFGHDQQSDHAGRYARAEEFADVVIGLWDSWDQDAFLRDRESGRYFDLEKMHPINHKGANFSVRGPMNLPPPPQGRPIMVQAGGSDPGKNLAARTADVVFANLVAMDAAQAFYRDLKGRMAKWGRGEDDLKIMPGVAVVVGKTLAEAEGKLAQLQELVQPEVGLDLLSGLIGFDLRGLPVDEPLPDIPETNRGKSRQHVIVDRARRENLTIRELYLGIAGGRGHLQIVGTPSQIADELEARYDGYAADGFNIMPPILPDGLRDFIELVIPELQRRGLFRTQYEGTTFRENLGLGPVTAH